MVKLELEHSGEKEMGIVEKLIGEVLAKIEKVDAELDALCGLVDMMPYIGLFTVIFSLLFVLIAGLTVGEKLKWKNGKIGGKRAIRISLLLGFVIGIGFNLYLGKKFADANEKVAPILNASAEIAYTANKLTKKAYVPAKIEKLIFGAIGRLDEELNNSRITCAITPDSRIEKAHGETMASLGKLALAPAMMYAYGEEAYDDGAPLWAITLASIVAITPSVLSFAGFFLFTALILSWAFFPSPGDPSDETKGEKEVLQPMQATSQGESASIPKAATPGEIVSNPPEPKPVLRRPRRIRPPNFD